MIGGIFAEFGFYLKIRPLGILSLYGHVAVEEYAVKRIKKKKKCPGFIQITDSGNWGMSRNYGPVIWCDPEICGVKKLLIKHFERSLYLSQQLKL